MENEFLKQPPHIGNMLRKYIKTNRLAQSAWARRQGVHYTNVVRYLKQSTMQVDTLFAICYALKYNFFKEIAAALPETMLPTPEHESMQKVIELEREVKELKLQVATLERALGLVGRKS